MMKKMVIDGTYIYSGKGFSHNAIRKIRDGGIVELGYSSWEDEQQWIEVLEDNFFVGFINSKTKLVDLNNYFYVMRDNLLCYEKPDINSEIRICLKRFDKIYLISKVFNKAHLWLKIYDGHGFCCYIDSTSCVCPNRFIPYSVMLTENTIMYPASSYNVQRKPIKLKKKSPIIVERLAMYNATKNIRPVFLDETPKKQRSKKTEKHSVNAVIANQNLSGSFTYITSLDNLTQSDDIWYEVYALGMAGYIPAMTQTDRIPQIDDLPYEHFMPNSDFHGHSPVAELWIPELSILVAGIFIMSIFPALSVFGIYFCVLGICLFTLKCICA